jgi:hypothetical protein
MQLLDDLTVLAKGKILCVALIRICYELNLRWECHVLNQTSPNVRHPFMIYWIQLHINDLYCVFFIIINSNNRTVYPKTRSMKVTSKWNTFKDMERKIPMNTHFVLHIYNDPVMNVTELLPVEITVIQVHKRLYSQSDKQYWQWKVKQSSLSTCLHKMT